MTQMQQEYLWIQDWGISVKGETNSIYLVTINHEQCFASCDGLRNVLICGIALLLPLVSDFHILKWYNKTERYRKYDYHNFSIFVLKVYC